MQLLSSSNAGDRVAEPRCQPTGADQIAAIIGARMIDAEWVLISRGQAIIPDLHSDTLQWRE